MTLASSTQRSDQDRAVLMQLGETATVEIGVADRDTIDDWAHLLRPATRIHITALPHQLWSETADAAGRLRAAGFDPVPHVAARQLRDVFELKALLGSLREADTREIFLIAGDRSDAIGAFTAVAQILRTKLLPTYGIRRVGFAGHPEGHPSLSAQTLREAEAEKVTLATAQGLAIRFVTQFAFETPPIVAWLQQLRSIGISADVSIGIAGPAQLSTLLKLAIRCGVGPSIAALGSRMSSMSKLLGDRRPDVLVRELGEARASGAARFQGIHFFAFGGVERTCRWVHGLREGKFTLNETGGFVLHDDV